MPSPADIRAARHRAGLTQAQAGATIGSTRRAWQEWEAGRRNMPNAKWELFLRKSREVNVLTLSNLIDQYGANGVIRIDEGNGCAGPMWCAWDDDLAGEIGGMEVSQVDPDSRAYDDGDNDRTYRQEAVHVIGDYDGDDMYASRWINGGNGYRYRFIF
ncbi:MAG: XRE family transcriptional regulator [Proteobacteria bacterium]|nr:XRE family transcriptional regulator [Pseudomonadota bacterium]